ncbi:MAG: hypothetical protein MAG458_01713 [Nitrosopumilus sp.]|nr:hypothetical protein [Nitrosopumilus sp.]
MVDLEHAESPKYGKVANGSSKIKEVFGIRD